MQAIEQTANVLILRTPIKSVFQTWLAGTLTIVQSLLVSAFLVFAFLNIEWFWLVRLIIAAFIVFCGGSMAILGVSVILSVVVKTYIFDRANECLIVQMWGLLSGRTITYPFVDIVDVVLGEEEDSERGRTYHPALLVRSGDRLLIHEDNAGAIQFAPFVSKTVALERVNLVRCFLDMELLQSCCDRGR